jgi:hypothetical protein
MESWVTLAFEGIERSSFLLVGQIHTTENQGSPSGKYSRAMWGSGRENGYKFRPRRCRD